MLKDRWTRADMDKKSFKFKVDELDKSRHGDRTGQT